VNKNNQAVGSHYLCSKSEGQLPEDTFTGWAGVIAACAIPSGEIPELASAGGDDPLITQAALIRLRCETSFGPSHIVEGGGDAQRFTRHQQSVGHWLVRDHLKIGQVEPPTEVRKRQLRERLGDSEHCLTMDGRFKDLPFEIEYVRPRRQRRQTLDLFWTRVHDGYHIGDLDALQVYLCTLPSPRTRQIPLPRPVTLRNLRHRHPLKLDVHPDLMNQIL
jgi:hypothetical protein